MKLFRVLPADHRRTLYLSGLCLSGVGVALVLSVLVTIAGHFANLPQLQVRGVSMTVRAVSGVLIAGIGFAAMAVAVHLSTADEHNDVADHDEGPRRSHQNRELLLRVGEEDVKLLDDVRRWPKIALPGKLPFGKLPIAAAETSVPTMTATTLTSSNQSEVATVVVKIRCRDCRRLSSEEASFCEHCGCRL